MQTCQPFLTWPPGPQQLQELLIGHQSSVLTPRSRCLARQLGSPAAAAVDLLGCGACMEGAEGLQTRCQAWAGKDAVGRAGHEGQPLHVWEQCRWPAVGWRMGARPPEPSWSYRQRPMASFRRAQGHCSSKIAPLPLSLGAPSHSANCQCPPVGYLDTFPAISPHAVQPGAQFIRLMLLNASMAFAAPCMQCHARWHLTESRRGTVCQSKPAGRRATLSVAAALPPRAPRSPRPARPARPAERPEPAAAADPEKKAKKHDM
jgi:hypothetical protein